MSLSFKGFRGKFSKTEEAYFKSCLVIFQVLLIPRAGSEATFPPVLVGVKINGGNFTHGVVTAPGMSDVVLQCIAIGATNIQWRRLVTQDLQPEWNRNADGSVITLPLNDIKGGTTNYSGFEGTYECAASNHKGLALSSPIRLIIPCIKTDYPPGKVAPVKNVYWNVGSLVIVQCNTSPVTFHPDMATVIYPRRIVWFFTNTTINPLGNSFQRLELPNVLPSSVMAYDGTLIIRRQLSIEMLIHKELECRIATPTANDGLYNLEISLGTYFPSIGSTSFSNAPGQSITLAYKSNDVIVLRGGICSIICVFDDPGNSIQNVSWSKLTGEPLQPDHVYFPDGMARLGILNAQYRHSGKYSCSYPGTTETGTIEVQVIRYPIISSSDLKDYYAVVGSTATLACLVDTPADAGFIWKYNDRIIRNDGKFQAQPKSQLQSELTIEDLELQDTGVVTCQASNKYGTTVRSVRLIVYKLPSVYLTNIVDELDTVYLDTVNSVQLNCNYIVDEQASEIAAVLVFEHRPDYVDTSTDDAAYGLVSPSITQFSSNAYLMTFSVNEETMANQMGKCWCIVRYTILDLHLNASSNIVSLNLQSTVTRTKPATTTTTETTRKEMLTAYGPEVTSTQVRETAHQLNDKASQSIVSFMEQHWWIGLIVFSVAVIAVVVGVNVVYRRRRRENIPNVYHPRITSTTLTHVPAARGAQAARAAPAIPASRGAPAALSPPPAPARAASHHHSRSRISSSRSGISSNRSGISGNRSRISRNESGISGSGSRNSRSRSRNFRASSLSHRS